MNNNRGTIKLEFEYYLKNIAPSRTRTKQEIRLGENAIRSYLSFIEPEKLFDYNLKKWNHIKSMYDIIDLKEVQKIVDTLLDDESFIERDKSDNKYFRSNSIIHYLSFINARSFFMNEANEKNINDNIGKYGGIKQIIYYGAPGTGKSYKIKEHLTGVSKDNIFRTTFHPDSDYSTFVGAYKPTMEKNEEQLYNKGELISKLTELKEQEVTYSSQKFGARYWKSLKELTLQDKKDILVACGMSENFTVEFDKGIAVAEELLKNEKGSRIVYSFIPQAFLNAYIQAYRTTENVYLIIEEINRGNCAQIFGDLFQLLDMDENGISEYPIKADADLRSFLENELGKDNDAIKDGELCLPSNLYIYATMNTSDQSLFPIDSAFKRRWDWEYEPIKYKNVDWVIDIKGRKYFWVSFQQEVNKKIFEANGSEDKMLGDYFVNPTNGIITEKVLLNKILFYLWNDVCKDGEGEIFKIKDNEDVTFSDLHGEDGSEKLIAMMEYLHVQEDDSDYLDIDENLPNGIYTKRHLRVEFLDGKVYEDNNSTKTLINTINKIGPEKVFQLDLKISGYPFLSKEKITDDGKGYGNSQRELDEGYYLITKFPTDAKLAKIQEISRRLDCNLKVSIVEV